MKIELILQEAGYAFQIQLRKKEAIGQVPDKYRTSAGQAETIAILPGRKISQRNDGFLALKNWQENQVNQDKNYKKIALAKLFLWNEADKHSSFSFICSRLF